MSLEKVQGKAYKLIDAMKGKVSRAATRLHRRLVMCLSNQDGFGTVEIVLLLLVLVGLVLIFKDKVSDLVSSIFGKITSQAGKI